MGTEKRERQKAGRAQRLEEARLAQKKAQRRRQIITIGALVAVVVVFLGVSAFFSNRSKNNEVSTAGSTTPSTSGASTTTTQAPFQYGTGPCPPVEGVPAPVLSFTSAPMKCIDPAKSYTATFDTTAGTVKAQLDTVRTPGTTNNFVTLSRYGYYNNTKIFRADKSIEILQGGSPHTNSATDQGPGYNITDEGGKFSYQPGQLVMARSQGPNSASAQFFFVVGPAAKSLDVQGTYVVFGNVSEGLPILQQILASATTGGELGGEPNPPVTINKVTIEESSTPPTSVPNAQAAPAAGQPVSPTPGGAAGQPVPSQPATGQPGAPSAPVTQPAVVPPTTVPVPPS